MRDLCMSGSDSQLARASRREGTLQTDNEVSRMDFALIVASVHAKQPYLTSSKPS